jgi:hypothetical protein
MISWRERLIRSGWFEVLLVGAGAALVAIGAPFARSASAIALLPLDLAVLAVAGGVIVIAARQDAQLRRGAAIGAILVILVAVPFTRIPSGGEVTVSVAIACAALSVLGVAGTRPRPTLAGAAGTALVLLLVVVTASSPDRAALLRLAPFVVASGPLLLLAAGQDRVGRTRTLRLVVVLAAVESVLALVEPLLASPQLWAPAKITAAGVAKTLANPLLPDLVRSQGTLGHPLTLGVLLLVAFALLVRNAAGLPVRPRIAAAVVLLGGLAVSGSRSSLFIAVLLGVVLVPRWRFGRRTVIALAVAVVAVVGGAVLAAPVLARWAASGSTTHRLGALDAVPGLLHQPPLRLLLGNGWASSNRIFDQGLLQNDGLKAVDEQFVLMLSQGGLLGLALLVLLLVLAVRHAGRALLPALLAVVVTMLVFDMLAWPSAAGLVALLVGCSSARSRDGTSDSPPSADRSAAAQERRAYSR